MKRVESAASGTAGSGAGRRAPRVVFLAWALVMIPATGEAQSSGEAAAMRAAERGGTILVCRHAITGRFNEREPVDYDDPSTQRQLNEEGEAQSRRIGEALRRRGVDIDELVASPMHRAYRTAELMFDDMVVRIDSIWHTNGSDYGGPANDARRRFLERPAGDGNVLVVSHIGTMSSVIREARGDVAEGDCVVVRPGGDDFSVVGIVGWRAWLASGEASMWPAPS